MKVHYFCNDYSRIEKKQATKWTKTEIQTLDSINSDDLVRNAWQ